MPITDIDPNDGSLYATSEASTNQLALVWWLFDIEGAKHIFVVTMGTLSGSHNSAQWQNIYLEDHLPWPQIHVIDDFVCCGGRLT